MTSTSINVGLGNIRSSSKVLKPPGGGTSDLFASPPDQADSPRKVRATTMSLPLGDTSPIAENDVPIYKPGNDSHSRLFGPPEPTQARKQVPISNINLGGPDIVISHAYAQETPNAPANGTQDEVKEAIETNSEVSADTQDVSGGNPVTGEGYESPKSNGSSPQLNGNAAAAANLRNRVPPGGFSSGLW